MRESQPPKGRREQTKEGREVSRRKGEKQKGEREEGEQREGK